MKNFLFTFLTIIYSTEALSNQPKAWQLGFQDAASESMREITKFHNDLLLPIIIAISVFVIIPCFSKIITPRPDRVARSVYVNARLSPAIAGPSWADRRPCTSSCRPWIATDHIRHTPGTGPDRRHRRRARGRCRRGDHSRQLHIRDS